MTIRVRALYLCYFGLRESLVQTQVLPYLRELVAGGAGISLLTFEPEPKKRWNAESIEDWRRRLREEGIEWQFLTYHKRPSLPVTLYDIVRGALRARSIVRRQRIDLIHGRSHVGAAIGALAKILTGARLIFDVRGLIAEEYVDSGNWRAGGVRYRLTKAAERWLFRAADGFVLITERSRKTLFPDSAGVRPVEVIPCCVDGARFAAAVRRNRDVIRHELGFTDRTVFVYVGSLGGSYLITETADLFAAARDEDPRAFALVITHSSQAAMTAALTKRGFSRDDFRIVQLGPEEVPDYLCASDVAMAIIRPSRAREGQSPAKLAEYLAAGLPVMATSGIGDLDEHLAEGRVGALLPRFDRAAYVEALRAVAELRRDPGLADRCRSEVLKRYDLETVGGERYRRLYGAVLGQ